MNILKSLYDWILYLLAHLVVFLKEGLGSPSLGVLGRFQVYFEKIRVLKAGFNA